MNKNQDNPETRESVDHTFREMAKAGVLKVVGHKMEDGKLAAVYRAVPPDELSAEARAFMGCSGEDMKRRIAEHYNALRERGHRDGN